MVTMLSGFVIVAVGMLVTALTGSIGAMILPIVLIVVSWLLFKNIASAPLQE